MTAAISVVVSSYNRAHLVPRLVAALETQDYADPYEVLIVDNGSADGTTAVLEELAAASRLRLRPLRIDHNDGPAPARNLGWRAAEAPLIAFTDDDCVPQPGWLAGLAAALEHADIAQGQTMANPTQERTGWFSWAPEAAFETGFYETCNIGYRREVLERTGGFDEGFRLAPRRDGQPRQDAAVWGDDTDLAWRAKATGAGSAFAADAIVWHDIKPGTLTDRLADLPRRAGTVQALKRHPELRSRMSSRWFADPAHGLLLIAVGAAAVGIARPRTRAAWMATGVAMGRWAQQRGQWYPVRDWRRALPQWFVVDCVEITILARASLRHRTLFL